MTIRTALAQGLELLERDAVPEPRLTAEVLLAHAIHRDRTYFYAHPEQELREVEWLHYGRYLDERLKGKPTQYITKRTEFYTREFTVSRDVLIPRPETELLVETILKLKPKPGILIDIGTGSGIIAVTLALELASPVTATDLSFEACAMARCNAAKLGANVQVLEADLLEPFADGIADVIVSNPPYIRISDRASLQREVRDWEPSLALYGGPTGTAVYERLIPEAKRVLKPGGILALEIGFGQSEAIAELAADWRNLQLFHDLAGIPRVLVCETAVIRTVFHVDMDAFFVSVEELYDPTLKGKAVVVGGKSDERGVVSAASYEARKFGVHSALPLRTAHKLCPHAIFVEGHPERYREYSGRVFEILRRFSPLVEMASVDEAYLDMTGTERLHGPAFRAAHTLHETVKAETLLNCSIGIATSRLVAKISSDQAKPNGILRVLPGVEARFLAPLEVRKVPGVGKVMEKNLHSLGIRRIGDLAALDESTLESRFGKWGLALAGKAQGLDAGGWFDSEIGERGDPKSISHEHTFNTDTKDRDQLESTLTHLAEKVARRLREHALHARTLQLKLRYSDFSTITRAQTFSSPTQLDIDLIEHSRDLLRANWDTRREIRLLGVQTSGFERDQGQLDLMDGGRSERWRQALEAADRLRDRYGESAVALGSGMRGRYRERVQENPAALPGKEPPRRK